MPQTREQIQQINDIEYEEVFIPEWLPKDKRSRIREIDGELTGMTGDDPTIREALSTERNGIQAEGTYCVWMLSAFEWGRLTSKTQKTLGPNQDENKQNHFARIAIASLRTQEGAPIFQDSDVSWLSKKSFKTLNRIATVASRINGVTENERDEALKNSATTKG